MTRREEREQAFCLVFEASFNEFQNIDALLETANEYKEIEITGYIRKALNGVTLHLKEIDDLIEANAKGWKVTRISKVSLAILRLAIFEVLFNKNVPENVAINEAVELAKTYDTDEAPPFINGVLGAISRMDK
jgi:N utilization substance protein B